jgi:hypothetical protein
VVVAAGANVTVTLKNASINLSAVVLPFELYGGADVTLKLVSDNSLVSTYEGGWGPVSSVCKWRVDRARTSGEAASGKSS